MKRKSNPAPRIDSSELAKNAVAFDEFVGPSSFAVANVKTATKTTQPILPLSAAAMLLF